ncbi:hypothetical protein KY311_03130 [Candidatus Woesearchaeota archaeon]|nr:hypothetical protein [Candidatus Woesearchaeota archaeon]MBW3017358.1 hypothetical protein [Candidatus Woesearchaeota archaeon]
MIMEKEVEYGAETLEEHLMSSAGIDLDKHYPHDIEFIPYQKAVEQKLAPATVPCKIVVDDKQVIETQIPVEVAVLHKGELELPESDYVAVNHNELGPCIVDKHKLRMLERFSHFIGSVKRATDITKDLDALYAFRNAVFDKDVLVAGMHGKDSDGEKSFYAKTGVILDIYNDIMENSEEPAQEQKDFLLKYLSMLLQNNDQTIDFVQNGKGRIDGVQILRLYNLFSKNKYVADNMFTGDAAGMYLMATQTKDDSELEKGVVEGMKSSTLGKLVLSGEEYKTVNKALQRFVDEPAQQHVLDMIENPRNPDEKAVGCFARMLDKYQHCEKFQRIARDVNESMKSRAIWQYLARDASKKEEAMPRIREYYDNMKTDEGRANEIAKHELGNIVAEVLSEGIPDELLKIIEERQQVMNQYNESADDSQ